MTEVRLHVIQREDCYAMTCPKCGKVLYSGDWHVVMEIGDDQYFVGETLRCCVLVRCQAAFPNWEGAAARLETIAGMVTYQQSLDGFELFALPDDAALASGPSRH